MILPLVLVRVMKLKYDIMSLTEKQTLDIHSYKVFTDHKNIYLKVPRNKALLTQIPHYNFNNHKRLSYDLEFLEQEQRVTSIYSPISSFKLSLISYSKLFNFRVYLILTTKKIKCSKIMLYYRSGNLLKGLTN